MNPWTFKLSINIVTIFIEFAVGFRIVLKFLGANPEAPFTAWIYTMSRAYTYPFRGMFLPFQIDKNAVIDTSAVFAFTVYLFAAYFCLRLIDYVDSYRVETISNE